MQQPHLFVERVHVHLDRLGVGSGAEGTKGVEAPNEKLEQGDTNGGRKARSQQEATDGTQHRSQLHTPLLTFLPLFLRLLLGLSSLPPAALDTAVS